MAYLNIAIIHDGKTANAAFSIDPRAFELLLDICTKAKGLMPRETLQSFSEAILHLDDVKHLTNEEMSALMGNPPTPQHIEFTDSNIAAAARAAHEANKTYCESIGDNSQLPWDQAPDWQKTSTINGVVFAIHNGFPPPEMMHDNWMKEKIAADWVYGEVKDETLKTHPCILPYDQLPEAQRKKDQIFRETVLNSLYEATNHGSQ
jgi:hypothetical protein